MGVESTELPQNLYEAVDPDALDGLFAGRDSPWCEVTFWFCGCRVRANGDGEVSIDGSAP